ncbi:hypothetical protein [Bacillus sp. KH172YL63]|uniref:hypothetical protein n=1 Tax=Bacillus sp. KH172YL63 TaxID=2709784 RepID=UPI0013E4D183|nr:hypothetical protein [Bacillus sp. KH172YL63]BCB04064.1 hypothetical protein KH172YL63_21970 [Bacillus sp. KH172YL63]
MQPTTFTFRLSDEGYLELLRNMPYIRKMYAFIITVLVTLCTLFSLSINGDLQAYTRSAFEVISAGVIAFLLSFVFLIALYFYIRSKWNRGLKKLARSLKEKYQGSKDEDYIIAFDQNEKAFYVGYRRHKIEIGQRLHVVSTSNYLLFYHGKGKAEDKFYIPKGGKEGHRESVRIVEAFLEKSEEVQFKRKRPS